MPMNIHFIDWHKNKFQLICYLPMLLKSSIQFLINGEHKRHPIVLLAYLDRMKIVLQSNSLSQLSEAD